MFLTKGVFASVFFTLALMLLPSSLSARGHHGGGHHGGWGHSGCGGIGHCTTHGAGHCGRHHRVTQNCNTGSRCGGIGHCATHGAGHCGKHHRFTRGCIPVKPPVKNTGNVEGVVFLDENGNGDFDDNEGVEDVKVVLYDSEGETHIDYTDSDGNYYFSDIPSGDATVKIIESTLPENSGQSVGENPSEVYVEADEDNDAGYDGYEVNYENDTGDVEGVVFIDKNGNGTVQDGEGVEGVTVKLYDSEGDTHTTKTDSDGAYYFSDIPKGDATVKIVESTLPENSGQVAGDNPSDLYVKPDEVNHAGYDGYANPASDEGTGSVIGVVFIDKNGNGTIQDGEGVAYVKVKLTDKNGDETITQTDKYGEYYFNDIPSGDVTIEVIESTLPINARQTVGENPSSAYVTPDEETHAGYDGYVCN